MKPIRSAISASREKARTLIFVGGFIVYCILKVLYDISTADHFLGAALIAYGPYWAFEEMAKAKEPGKVGSTVPNVFWLLARSAFCVAGGVLLIVG